ncbi:class I SAM-dependent methyltransferase [Pseudanabaena sp. PCC 6802]|uniref:class I SAM-dependent methyltransferase n=1 Tax=Pseudanabaena sp. PCC 6802 TaxID=118173 RepID=UPI00034BAE1A|nr:class I SAM-dependent methyltransferase [Pseudanabaena sp. PCC 6802]
MSTNERHEFPRWEELYQEAQIESMPWFNPELDEDLRIALDELGLKDGSALDLGTGPGTQAIELARRGFSMTATDLSAAAIARAQQRVGQDGLKIDWKQDDILDTCLDRQFDFIFDRGCFHVLPPERRQDYVRTVGELLKMGSYLFLKCFSRLQSGEQGPYRFTPEQIREIFGSQLKVISIKETVYQGTLKPLPQALFCVMQREM